MPGPSTESDTDPAFPSQIITGDDMQKCLHHQSQALQEDCLTLQMKAK